MADELEASFTLVLKKPITFGGKTYNELILQEPTGKQARRADEQLRNGATPASLRNREQYLLSLVSGVPLPVIEDMGVSDINRGMAYLNPFLMDGLQTGDS